MSYESIIETFLLLILFIDLFDEQCSTLI